MFGIECESVITQRSVFVKQRESDTSMRSPGVIMARLGFNNPACRFVFH